MKKTLCVAGKNNIAIRVLEYCKNRLQTQDGMWGEILIDLTAAITRQDTGVDGWQRSYKKYCLLNKIPILELEELYEIKNLIFISVEYDRILRVNKFKSEELFNIHFSALPKYKGMYPSVLPILYDEKSTGVTFHKIDCGIDTGEIIAQKQFIIPKYFTSFDLYLELIDRGTELVIQNLDRVIKKNYLTFPQEKEHSFYYSSGAIDFEKLQLELQVTAYQLQLQIRAYSFRPYQLPIFYDIPIIGCKILDRKSQSTPGSIILENDILFEVSTIDYDVVLYKDRVGSLKELIKNDMKDEIKRICLYDGLVNEKDEEGKNAVIVAAEYGRKELLEFLVEKKARIDDVDYKGNNALYYARNNVEVYKYLLELGVMHMIHDFRVL